MTEKKPGLLAKALRYAFEDYFGEKGERLPRLAVEPVAGDEVPVHEPLADEPGDD